MVKVPARAIVVGDSVDLEGVAQAAPFMTELDQHAAEFELFPVVEVETGPAGEALIGVEGLFGMIPFAPDFELETNRQA